MGRLSALVEFMSIAEPHSALSTALLVLFFGRVSTYLKQGNRVHTPRIGLTFRCYVGGERHGGGNKSKEGDNLEGLHCVCCFGGKVVYG